MDIVAMLQEGQTSGRYSEKTLVLEQADRFFEN
jgi:hypothetical protein